MLKKEDEDWVRAHYPGLSVERDSVTGTVEFTASYDRGRNLFFLPPQEEDAGLALSCNYRIRIQPRSTSTFSRLPALFVDDIDATGERHFGRDRTACLCSPFEERDFLEPEFDFKKFFQRLVIPFLYGQRFFSQEGRWPWGEYAHLLTGLLEAFDRADARDARACVHMLSQYKKQWPRIRQMLRERKPIRGSTQCFCGKVGRLSTCHNRAFEGLRRLHILVREQHIPLPLF